MCLLHQVEVLVEVVVHEVLVEVVFHEVLGEENLNHLPKQENALLVEETNLSYMHRIVLQSFFLALCKSISDVLTSSTSASSSLFFIRGIQYINTYWVSFNKGNKTMP